MKHLYLGLLTFGLLLAIGAAGGSDCGSLTLGQAALYGIVGVAIAGIGAKGLRGYEQEEDL